MRLVKMCKANTTLRTALEECLGENISVATFRDGVSYVEIDYDKIVDYLQSRFTTKHNEFPVDVGDKVWYIYGGYYCKSLLQPREITVTEISKKKNGKTVDWAFIANGTRYKFSSIGKSVFLSKKDCEAEINRRLSKGRKK